MPTTDLVLRAGRNVSGRIDLRITYSAPSRWAGLISRGIRDEFFCVLAAWRAQPGNKDTLPTRETIEHWLQRIIPDATISRYETTD